MEALLIQVGVPLVLLIIGWIAGHVAERRHLQSIERREKELAGMLITDVRTFPGGADPVAGTTLVLGEVVIASDYLKRFLAKLRNLVGGELKSFRSLLERGRREALLRMKARAREAGCDAVCNIRLNTATIGKFMIEVHVSGTAYRRQDVSGV